MLKIILELLANSKNATENEKMRSLLAFDKNATSLQTNDNMDLSFIINKAQNQYVISQRYSSLDVR